MTKPALATWLVLLTALSAPLLRAQASAAASTAPATAASPPVDYRSDASWLCRPGRTDACTQDQTATRVDADGRLTVEPFKAAAAPAIDCFYVYPTVSYQQTANADMTLGPEERVVADLQFARFSSQCRPFAPLYRQSTLYALRQAALGKSVRAGYQLAYEDVKAAWLDYLARDNHGRGVVLIGHSQGSNLLMHLIAEEIDGKPVQARLVSALLMGVNLPVPRGADVGGGFKSIPLCRRTGQTGCVVAYASFRASSPPPENARFGRGQAGMAAACVNPAALGGGVAMLHSYFPTQYNDPTHSTVLMPEWVPGGPKITTPFVTTPGLLTGECVSDEHGDYLAITLHAGADDRRTHDIGGDIQVNSVLLKDWGLHQVDVSLAMGDLVTLVGTQSAAYVASKPR